MRRPGNQARLRAAGRKVGKKKVTEPAAPSFEWTGWRGPNRDGRAPALPERLPAQPKVVWEKPLFSKALGGVAATREYVLVSDRELDDTTDVFKCLRADTGKEVWTIRYPAPGQLDFGNSPRATPLIHNNLVYLAGAFGHLSCAELATGKILWDMDIREDFGAKDERKWGMCSSPLVVNGRLIVNPGAKDASLVALEPRTGKVLWKTPGKSACYGSLLAGTFGGREQIVGFDADSLGGWDVVDGKRLWELKPENRSDFNVPTPLRVDEQLLVALENNGTALYRFAANGLIDPKAVARYDDLSPDTHTPVVVGQRVFGVWRGLHCLDLKANLKPLWISEEEPFMAYASIIASDHCLLVTTITGELLLIDARADQFMLRGRLKVLKDERGVYSHPALVGTRLYLRGNSALVCLELKSD